MGVEFVGGVVGDIVWLFVGVVVLFVGVCVEVGLGGGVGVY